MDSKSLNITAEKLEQLRSLFPDVFSEGEVDFARLKDFLGENVAFPDEHYELSWAGKAEAHREIQKQTTATLVPDKDGSVNFGETENIFIEGENLEVLRILQRSYFGKIKMIYIDPPYNTGNDSFVYPDDYAERLDEYNKRTGKTNEEGYLNKQDLWRKNSRDNGQFHSVWLSMMYPRLFLARNLLRDDGTIFVSIDDHESHNLRLLMNDIFGEENFIAQLVWEKGRKNDARLFSVGHEYILVYAKSRSKLDELRTVWREPKPGAKEIWSHYLRLRDQHGDDDEAIEKALRLWYASLPENNPSKKLSRYKHIDKWGPWRDTDISWPGGGGPRYDVIHPVTGKACQVPERGWRFANPESMQRRIELGLIEFRKDHTEPPLSKAHLRPIPEELFDDTVALDEVDMDDSDIDVGMQVMPSYIYKQSQVAVKYLRKLMGGKAFENPKDHEVLARLIKYVIEDETAIVLDFFAGSASTAEAVVQVNHDEQKKLSFILVQYPEQTPENSPARKLGFEIISDISKARIAKVYEQLRDKNPLFAKQGLDLGLKIFRLRQSNFKMWQGDVEGEELLQQLDIFRQSEKDGSTEENMLYELLLKSGLPLTTKVERAKVGKQSAYLVEDGELLVFFGEYNREVKDFIREKSPRQVVCLDSAFKGKDKDLSNFKLELKEAGIELAVI